MEYRVEIWYRIPIFSTPYLQNHQLNQNFETHNDDGQQSGLKQV